MSNETLNLQSLKLNTPTSLTGSFYFTKLLKENKEELTLTLKPGNLKKKVSSVKKNDNFVYFHINPSLDTDQNELSLLLENIEERIIELLYENSENWFENEISIDDIRECFFGFTKFEKGGKELSVKLKLNLDKYDLNTVVLNNKKITIDEFNELNNFIPIVHISGIKFNSKNFYVILELKDYKLMELQTNELVGGDKEMTTNNNETNTIDYDESSNTENTKDIILNEETNLQNDTVIDIDEVSKEEVTQHNENDKLPEQLLMSNNSLLNENNSQVNEVIELENKEHDETNKDNNSNLEDQEETQQQIQEKTQEEPEEPEEIQQELQQELQEETQEQIEEQPQEQPQEQLQEQIQEEVQEVKEEVEKEVEQEVEELQEEEENNNKILKNEDNKIIIENNVEDNDTIEEINLSLKNLEEKHNFNESKNVLKLNENRLLFYKLYVLFSEQIKTHQIDTILGKFNDLNINYDKFIDFLNDEDEVYLNEENFSLV